MRPEDIVVGPADGKGLSVTVDLVEELGADGYLYGHTEINGKRADLVLTDLPNHSHLTYELGRNPVQRVIKSGAVVQ